MSHSKPFHRNYRGFVDCPNSGYSQWAYIVDRSYADSPEHYIRAFIIIQSDLQRLFEFIEPSDQNLIVYSYRIHELFMRTCMEVEANFKAILRENIYNPIDKKGKVRPEKRWNIHDYRKVNSTHHLSAYKVYVPIWDGESSIFEPFKQWADSTELSWYQAYNKSKHDRRNEFKEANLENLLSSFAGLLVLLSSQFRTEDFSPGSSSISGNTDSYYFTKPALGGYFHIEFPNDWDDSEQYEFNWSELKNESDRFQKINYDSL
ncbi:MAG: hypothetical protein ISS57_08750 [Anaerolineales bacterium]|nr:hypothetical protein [Deltaproteobacteria bacterium]MBL7162681.1 hypothetical protein [Anaerolineales bacterium]